MALTVAQLGVNVTGNTSAAEATLSTFAGKLPGLAGTFAKFALGGALVIGGIGLASIKMAGDFQASMTNLVTGAGESQKNLKTVSDGILKMAVDTGTATSALSAGMFVVESAGYRAKDGLAVMTAAAEGAKVGNADLTSMTDVLTTALHNYALKSSAAVPVVNSFISTVANGKMVMDDLNQSLTGVLPTASKAGIALTDVEGALATMAASGDKGAAAGTHLSQMFQSLENPSAKASKTLREIGLTTQGVADDMKKSLPNAIQTIYDALAKKFPVGSVAFNAAAANIVGGNKQVHAWNELTGTSFKDLVSNTDAISGAYKNSGKSVTGFNLVQQDFNFKVSQAKEVVETLLIKLGTGLLPMAGKLVDFFSGTLVPGIENFAESLGKPNSGAGKLAATFTSTFLPILKNLVNVVTTDVIPTVESIASTIVTQFIPAVVNLVDQVAPVLTPALSVAGGILKNVLGPAANVVIHAFSGLLTGVTAVIKFIKNNQAVFDTLKIVLLAIGAVLLATAIPGIAASVIAFGAQAIAAGAAAIAVVAATWPFIAIGAAIVGVIFVIVEIVQHWKEVTEAMGWVKDRIGDLLGKLGDLKDLLVTLATAGLKAFGDLWSAVSGWVGNVIGAITGIPAKIGQGLGTIGSTISQTWTTIKNDAAQFGSDLLTAIGNAIQKGLGALGNVAGKIGQTIKGAVNNIPGIGGIASWAGFAAGTNFAPGGVALVGEDGPELMDVPRGAAIYTTAQTRQILSNVAGRNSPLTAPSLAQSGGSAGQSSGPITVIMMLDSKVIAKQTLPHIANEIRLRAGSHV